MITELRIFCINALIHGCLETRNQSIVRFCQELTCLDKRESPPFPLTSRVPPRALYRSSACCAGYQHASEKLFRGAQSPAEMLANQARAAGPRQRTLKPHSKLEGGFATVLLLRANINASYESLVLVY